MVSTTLALTLAIAGQTFDLPKGLLSGLCFVESSHQAFAIHREDGIGDSIGLCQVKLATARWLGYTGDARGLLVASVNAHYAAKYLRYQLNRYHGNIEDAVSAYNAGHATYSNRSYVDKVNKARQQKR